MYDLKPSATYVMARAQHDAAAMGRMANMLVAMGNPAVELVTDADIPRIIAAHQLGDSRNRANQIKVGADPIVVFNALRVDDGDADVDGILAKCPPGTPRVMVTKLLGYDGMSFAAQHLRNEELVCRRAYEFNTVEGCPHRCLYCPTAGEGVMSVGLNIEEFIEKKLGPVMRDNPHQKVFRFQTQASDSLCIEPEYGAVKVFAEHFAQTADQYLLLHTKSTNADFLRDLDHRGHTIALWSLTSDTVSREIERGSGTLEGRILAAVKCAAAGYPIRFKFKPIVPVRNWRDETRDMIRRVFEAGRLDVVSLCAMMWMPVDELESAIDPDTLDPEFVDAARKHADEMAGSRAAPFPHDVRAEMYTFFFDEIRKHDQDVRVSLSTETMDMWREFEDRLGAGPGSYVCGCGPQCPPGVTRLGRDVLKDDDAA